jgi:ribosomal protein S18 acetylase RimI-like enzyme
VRRVTHGAITEIRDAPPADADEMSRVLNEIFQAKGREQPSEPSFVLERYIGHPNRIKCSVALDEQVRISGFQSLQKVGAGNPYGVLEGWGIIGTHISPNAARRGVGAALFEISRQAAETAGLPMIDATIGDNNEAALAYYSAMGFRTYRESDGCICKAFRVGIGSQRLESVSDS